MKTVKPFTWTVALTVGPRWVAGGFALTDTRALDMLACETNEDGDSVGLAAKVIAAPRSLEIIRVQGYAPTSLFGRNAKQELDEGSAHAGTLRSALLAAYTLLDSAAFVNQPGDTYPVKRKIVAALKMLDPRQGDPVQLDD